MKFYPYHKGGGAEKVLAMLKAGGGGHNKLWGGSLSHIERGHKMIPIIKRGA